MAASVVPATEAPGPPAAVTLRQVTHRFPDPGGDEGLLILDRFDLEVQSGECVALIGPSGCGKTTLLRLMAGLLAPNAGEVEVLSMTPGEAQRCKAMGVMFQAPALLPWRSALENVRLPLQVNRQSPSGSPLTPDRAAQLLDLVGLRGFERHLPNQLSGGMQQRVALARALVTDPPLLLMDEPFSSLDELTRAILQRDFLRLREQREPTILLVTHSVEEAVLLADRVVVLSARPAQVIADLDVHLPWPRSTDVELLDSNEARQLVAQLRRLLREV